MSDQPPGSGEERCERCDELQAEVTRLRAEVARLREANAALVRRGIDRDFERPPHYLQRDRD